GHLPTGLQSLPASAESERRYIVVCRTEPPSRPQAVVDRPSRRELESPAKGRGPALHRPIEPQEKEGQRPRRRQTQVEGKRLLPLFRIQPVRLRTQTNEWPRPIVPQQDWQCIRG